MGFIFIFIFIYNLIYFILLCIICKFGKDAKRVCLYITEFEILLSRGSLHDIQSIGK